MDDLSLTHTKYNCTYHIVFVPKYRRKVMYGQLRQKVGQILSTVCKITGIQLIKGGVCPDHVHMYISIPPKMSLSTVMSKLKGKSALMIFDRHPEYRDKYGRHFGAGCNSYICKPCKIRHFIRYNKRIYTIFTPNAETRALICIN